MFDLTPPRLKEPDAASLANVLLTTLSHINDFAYIFDLDGRFLYANQPLLDLWGISLDEAVGKNFFDLKYPADLAAQLQREIEEVIETRKPVRGETPYTSETGQAGFYEYIFSPVFGKDGVVTNVAGSTRVITERKQHEAQLARLVQEKEVQARLFDATLSSINDLAYSFDLEGNWMYANKSLLELWGRKLPDIVGKSSLELDYPPELAATLKAQVKQVVATGKPFRGETFFTSAAGVVDYHEYIFSPVFAPDGSVTAVCGTTRLITERKRAERELQKRSERMQLLSETLAQLLKARDPETVVRELFPKVAAHLDVDTYFNFMTNAQGDALELHSCAGIPEETARSIKRLEFGQAICGTVAQIRQPIVANDIQHSNYDKADLVRGFGIQTYACNPLMVEDRLLGTLSFASRTRASFDSDELDFIRIISQHTAIALDRLSTTKALRESGERLTASLEAAGTGTFRWNMRTNSLDWDEPLDRLFGFVPGKTVRSLAQFIETVHPDDRAEVIARCERSARDGVDFHMEFRVIWPNGSMHWLEDKGKISRDANGQPEYMVGACVDITERKQSEAQLIQQKEVLEQIVRGAPLSEILENLTRNVERFAERKLIATILLISSDGRHLLSAAGRSVPEEWSRYIHGVEIGPAVGSCGTAAFRGERVIVSDIATDPLWANYSSEALKHGLRACWSSPLHSSDGKVLGTFAIYYSEPSQPTRHELEIVDIVTRSAAIAIERKASEQALKESREKLEEHARTLEQRVTERTADLLETNEQLEQFCYTIAHDLRAPLRAQEGFATMLRDDFAEALGTRGQDYAQRIVQAARRLDRLVQDLLSFSRIGRGAWHVQSMPLRTAFEEARENLAGTIRDRQATLTVGTLDGNVRAHPATLMLILQNLLANALKFVAPGAAPKITVWAEDKQEFVRLNIKDEGIGIPSDQHERIFGVFQRLHNTQLYPGTGIGLSLVLKGIERMDGRVGLESAPGHGSQFWIEIPKTR